MSAGNIWIGDCRSKLIELDERMLRIVHALMAGPLRFNQLKRVTGMHQEVLSRKIKVLRRYCIITYFGGYYYLCKDAVKKIIANYVDQ